MNSFYLLWTGCYFVLLGLLAKKWPKNQINANSSAEYPSVTLLIPFRNEAENLGQLTKELLKLDYPFLEIFLVDDQSEDQSVDILRENLKGLTHIQVIQSIEGGKKNAIELGVRLAKSELILCSDADCTFPSDWIARMVYPFRDAKIQLVAGPVMSREEADFFHRFQLIEWSSILLLTQFFFSQKSPLMCSGANLGYRKSAFDAVNGYDQNRQFLSGDDEFLLKKMTTRFGGDSCAYLPYLKNLVETKPQSTFSDLLNQRIRWAGKWRMHRDLGHAFSATLSFATQLVWLSSFVLLGDGLSGLLVFTGVWLGKSFTEKIFLGKVLASFERRFSFLDYLKTGILHPFYVLAVGLGAFRGKFTWKGRSN